jgi:2-polyprenyl-3-methyl-5-hydroxy-6-metoxy-1,4-benzoquinol methylase
MDKLTDDKYWDKYWDKMGNTQGVYHSRPTLVMECFLKIFHNYLKVDENLHVLEIGGAPGDYLIYFHKHFKYQVHSLDFSATGNEQTRQNFKRAGIPIQLYEKDLFSDLSDLPKFDIVFSLGFIEHFDNTLEVVSRHLELVKPGGLLLLGVPNFTGIYYPFLKRLAPDLLNAHYLDVMHIKNWDNFEKSLNMTCLYKSYVGGFEPLNMKKIEKKTLFNKILYFKVKVLMVMFSFRMKFLRRFNSRLISAYLIGIYKKNA